MGAAAGAAAMRRLGLGSAGAHEEDEAVADLIRAHAARYPRLEAQDLYKLLHQAALGSEHAVAGEAAARQWLVREMAGLGPGPGEPLIDPVSPDGRLARVHLRPYLAAGHAPDRLVDAFVRTASRVEGSVSRLARYGAIAWHLAEQGQLPLGADAVAALFEAQAAAGYPAAHHSVAYRDAYAPAYRVVLVEWLELAPKA
jgi:hypothetical protein